MSESHSDEDLLASFLEGSERSFEQLMERHEPRVFAVALQITGSHSDAYDATQDAFVTAFRRAATFRGEAAFGTWLYRIAINASKDIVRKRKPTEELDTDTDDPVSTGSMDEAVVGRMELANALQELPEEYREAVVMHDIGGVPYEEIASLTGVRIGTVKSRISRGRRRLAETLEPGRTVQPSKEQL